MFSVRLCAYVRERVFVCGWVRMCESECVDVCICVSELCEYVLYELRVRACVSVCVCVHVCA